jgi:hypothetical protein
MVFILVFGDFADIPLYSFRDKAEGSESIADMAATGHIMSNRGWSGSAVPRLKQTTEQGLEPCTRASKRWLLPVLG